MLSRHHERLPGGNRKGIYRHYDIFGFLATQPTPFSPATIRHAQHGFQKFVLSFIHLAQSETRVERGSQFVNIILRRIEHHSRANHLVVKPAFADDGNLFVFD